MSECLVCGAATDLYLCNEDRDELTDALTGLPRWMEHLVEAATGQARLGGAVKRGRGDDDPLRVNLRASELLDEITNGLGTWVRHLCETRGIVEWTPLHSVPHDFIGPIREGWRRLTPGYVATVQDRTLWLFAHIDAIACDPAADEIFDEVTGWPGRIEKLIDRPAQQWICGPCPTIIERNGHRSPCNLALYAADPDAVITCPRCKTEHRARNLRQSLILRARYLPMTQACILRALDELGESLDRTTFISWTKPNASGLIRMPSRGTNPTTGEPHYWLDDARKVHRRSYPERARKRVSVDK